MRKKKVRREMDPATREIANSLHDAFNEWLDNYPGVVLPERSFGYNLDLGPADENGLPVFVLIIGIWAMDFREEMEAEFATFEGRTVTFVYEDDVDDPEILVRLLAAHLLKESWMSLLHLEWRRAVNIFWGVLKTPVPSLWWWFKRR